MRNILAIAGAVLTPLAAMAEGPEPKCPPDMVRGLVHEGVALFFGEPSDDRPLRIATSVSTPALRTFVAPDFSDEHRLPEVIVLELVIDRDGSVRSAMSLKPLETEQIASLAAAVRKWRFAPARFEGEPVSVLYTVVFCTPDRWSL